MQLGFILALLFSILIAIFAILNNEVVEINYFFGRAPVSVIIVILASAFTGALIVGLFSLVGRIKFGFRSREHHNQLKKMEEDLTRMAQRESELLEKLSRLEEELYGEEEEEPPKVQYTQDITPE